METDELKHYIVLDTKHYCCDEFQFVHKCKKCEEIMGCYFCEFDYNEPHCEDN